VRPSNKLRRLRERLRKFLVRKGMSPKTRRKLSKRLARRKKKRSTMRMMP
jgi:hypothetical protein